MELHDLAATLGIGQLTWTYEKLEVVIGRALSLQGLTVQEISSKLKRSERMVYRILKVVKQRLERKRDSDGENV